MIHAHFRAAYVFLILMLVTPLFAEPEPQGQLRRMISGKTLFLRFPKQGAELRYDRGGQLANSAAPGGWLANAAVKIGNVDFKDGALKIEGRRCLAYYDAKGKLQIVQSEQKVTIIAPLQAADPSVLKQLVEKIFYPEGDKAAIAPPPSFDTLPDGNYEACERKEGRLGYKLKGTAECRVPGSITEPIVLATLPDGQKVYAPTVRVDRARLKPGYGARLMSFMHELRLQRPGLPDRMSTLGHFAATITVDERGNVASARISQSFNPIIDAQILAKIAEWNYEPAKLETAPVGSIELVRTSLTSRN